MVLLVTGFAPFGGLSHNPSERLLSVLPSELGGHRVRTAVLPVATEEVGSALQALYAESPRLVLHLGLGRERERLSLERVALNVLDFEIPDNAGQERRDCPIDPGGPLALASRLPLRRILEAWSEHGIPAEISNSAGTYLCNQTMYLALSRLPESTPVGFIHLPPDEVLGPSLGQPFVSLEVQARAIRLALELCLATLGT